MLLTICPNCNAKFKVSPEQLNVRQGRVMCGRCRNVFNAFEALKRVEDRDSNEPVDDALLDPTSRAAPAAPASPTAAPVVAPTLVNEEALDSYEDALKKLEQFNLEREVSEPPSVDTEADEFDPAEPLLAERADLALSEAETTETSMPRVPLSDNPLISGAAPVPATQSRAWGWLAAMAAIAFALQTAFYFRSEIVQQYPQVRPQLAAACEYLDCTISWGRDTSLIKIESSDLIEPPGRPGKILLTATLANRASTKQDYPALEVKLTDANNGVLSSRVLQPAEYLGRIPQATEGMAPNAELYINLNLELTGKSPASGYGLRAFYP